MTTKTNKTTKPTIKKLDIKATSRDDIIFELRAEHGLDQKEAQAYYNEYHKGTSATGFFNGYLDFLTGPDFKEMEDAGKYIGANGSANTMKHASHFSKIAEAILKVKK